MKNVLSPSLVKLAHRVAGIPFAKKLLILIGNPELRMEMSNNSYNNIRKFDKILIINKWIDTFNSL